VLLCPALSAGKSCAHQNDSLMAHCVHTRTTLRSHFTLPQTAAANLFRCRRSQGNLTTLLSSLPHLWSETVAAEQLASSTCTFAAFTQEPLVALDLSVHRTRRELPAELLDGMRRELPVPLELEGR